MTTKPNETAGARASGPNTNFRHPNEAVIRLTEKRASATGLADQIGRAIVSGQYEAGALLPNEQIMLERFAVSRTALREAYSKLTAKGLVHARPRVGTSVLPRIEWNMLDQDVLAWHLQTKGAADIADDLYQIRRMIEPAAAELAATTRTDADMARIEAAFAAMKVNSGDQETLVEADFRFHVAILTATHNGFISAFSALIRAAMLATFDLSWRGAEVIKDHRLQQHGDVAAAIRAGDARLARATMEQLLDQSMDDVRGGISAVGNDKTVSRVSTKREQP